MTGTSGNPSGPLKVPTKQRVWAAFLVVIAVVPMVLTPSTANALSMCGLLLLAWREAFYLSPLLRTRMKDVYAGYREGRFASDRVGRLASAAASLFILASFIVRLKDGA